MGFNACGGANGKVAFPVDKPKNDHLEREMKKLGVCTSGGRLVVYADPKKAAELFAKIEQIKVNSLGRSVVAMPEEQEGPFAAGPKKKGKKGDGTGWWVMGVMGAIVAAAVAIQLWKKGDDDGDDPTWHEVQGHVTIRQGGKQDSLGVFGDKKEKWPSTVFLQAVEKKEFSEIVKAVREQYRDVTGIQIKEQLKGFAEREWVTEESKTNEATGQTETFYTVAIEKYVPKVEAPAVEPAAETTPVVEGTPVDAAAPASAGRVPMQAETLAALEAAGIDKATRATLMMEHVGDDAGFAAAAAALIASTKPDPQRDFAATMNATVARLREAGIDESEIALFLMKCTTEKRTPDEITVLAEEMIAAASPAAEPAGDTNVGRAPVEPITLAKPLPSVNEAVSQGVTASKWSEVLANIIVSQGLKGNRAQIETQINEILKPEGIDMNGLGKSEPVKLDGMPFTSLDMHNVLTYALRLNQTDMVKAMHLWQIMRTGEKIHGSIPPAVSDFFLKLASVNNRLSEVYESDSSLSALGNLQQRIDFQLVNTQLRDERAKTVFIHAYEIIVNAFVGHLAVYMNRAAPGATEIQIAFNGVLQGSEQSYQILADAIGKLDLVGTLNGGVTQDDAAYVTALQSTIVGMFKYLYATHELNDSVGKITTYREARDHATTALESIARMSSTPSILRSFVGKSLQYRISQQRTDLGDSDSQSKPRAPASSANNASREAALLEKATKVLQSGGRAPLESTLMTSVEPRPAAAPRLSKPPMAAPPMGAPVPRGTDETVLAETKGTPRRGALPPQRASKGPAGTRVPAPAPKPSMESVLFDPAMRGVITSPVFAMLGKDLVNKGIDAADWEEAALQVIYAKTEGETRPDRLAAADRIFQSMDFKWNDFLHATSTGQPLAASDVMDILTKGFNMTEGDAAKVAARYAIAHAKITVKGTVGAALSDAFIKLAELSEGETFAPGETPFQDVWARVELQLAGDSAAIGEGEELFVLHDRDVTAIGLMAHLLPYTPDPANAEEILREIADGTKSLSDGASLVDKTTFDPKLSSVAKQMLSEQEIQFVDAIRSLVAAQLAYKGYEESGAVVDLSKANRSVTAVLGSIASASSPVIKAYAEELQEDIQAKLDVLAKSSNSGSGSTPPATAPGSMTPPASAPTAGDDPLDAKSAKPSIDVPVHSASTTDSVPAQGMGMFLYASPMVAPEVNALPLGQMAMQNLSVQAGMMTMMPMTTLARAGI